MDQLAAHGGGIGPTYSLLRHIFFGDCAELRSDDFDAEISSSSGGRSSRRSCSISIPVMVLDLIWNLAFVVVSIAVLVSASGERPSTPLRIWVWGYCMQCLFHLGFACFQYRRRRRIEQDHLDDHSSIIKRLESINTVISSIWWVIGFYWIVVGGQALIQYAPRLYWLKAVSLAFDVFVILLCIGMAFIVFFALFFCCIPILAVAFAVAFRLTVVFLAFDVFFILFCLGMACIIFFVVFCCIPIFAVAYAVAMRKGAREDDIKSLPKYRYCHDNRLRLSDDDKNRESIRAKLGLINTNQSDELALLPEDSDCCICLSKYIEGVDLYMLPCKHHFHCGCISKWLRINATCPLCKCSIRKGDTLA